MREGHAPAVAALVAGKLALGALLLATGFYALSDDDFSRVVVAQTFAAAPSLDPSGTSWLPFPFWLTGTAMLAFGRTLEVARAVGLASGVAAVLLVYRAALDLGASRRSALLGAAVAGAFPTSLRLGVTFTPEALTAGLVVFGAAAGGRAAGGARHLWGGIALAAACLSRYEAWPAALVFALFALRGGLGARSSGARPGAYFAAAALAVAAPLGWVLHGVRDHGDALFFLHRVSAYRRSLGETEGLVDALLSYPIALVVPEPPAGPLFAAVVFLAYRYREILHVRSISAFSRPLAILASVFVFLVAGRLGDGAPTHHAGRTLLPILFGALAVLSAAASRAALPAAHFRLLPGLVAALAVAAVAGTIHGNRWYDARADDRAIGHAARLEVRGAARVAVDTPDYGYFAVIAAFGAPERAEPLLKRDPRETAAPDPFRSSDSLRTRLTELRAEFLVTHRPHFETAFALGAPAATRGDRALVRLGPPRPQGTLP